MREIFKIKFWAVALTMAIIAVACSNEDTPKPLPTLDNIECKAGDRPQFVFTSNHDWHISSDALWCKFITAAGEVQDTSGKAGTHTITLRISDVSIKDEPTTARVTIRMGATSQTLVVVERAAKELVLKIKDSNNKTLENIELGYNDWQPFNIEANFNFAATTFPEWVELGTKEGENIVTGIAGTANEPLTAYARIIPDGERECYPITADQGNNITFADAEGKASFSFPIVFDGMGEDKLTFTAPTADTFGWEVSLDGTLFRQVGETAEESVTFKNSLSYNITSRNKEYTALLIEKVIDRGISSYVIGADWMHFANGTLTVDATNATRYGMVVALPNGIYNDICNNLSENLFELDYTSGVGLPTLKNDYLGFVLIEFTQRDFSEQGEFEGMYIYHSLTALEIPATPYTDSAVMAEYGAEEAYTVEVIDPIAGKRPSIVIDPRIELWTTASFDQGTASADVYYKGERLKISEDDYYLGENKDEKMALYLWYPKAEAFTENVYIIFKVDGMAKKMLVVTPTTK
jgi:hypothetical protein